MIVAHGNIIRSLVARALGLDHKLWLNMSIVNCSVTQMDVLPDGHIRIVSVGDMGHLPPALQGNPAPMWVPAENAAPKR